MILSKNLKSELNNLKKIFLDKNEQIYKLSIGLKKAKSLLSDVIYKTIKNNNKVKVNRNEFIPK